MLTGRGWWFLAVTVILLTVTIWTNTPALALVCLTLLVWFFASLVFFVFRLYFLANRLTVVRHVHDERGPVQSLWVERTFTVHVELQNRSLLPTPYLRMTDRVPFGTSRLAGDLHKDGELMPRQALTATWHMHCNAPGLIRFEGVKVQFADLQGFFYARRFVRAVNTYRVLPAFADASGHAPSVKRNNILPMIGPHRFHRPGSGSELLDLRDYLPGDPPKTIAWKVSARRDRLITKEFESEVPLRCTFFVDASSSVRAGTIGENALARLVDITSALAQATAAFRDLPGLCLFDEHKVQHYLRPARTPRHVIKMINTLAGAASLPPAAANISVLSMLPLAYGFAEEIYPDLLEQRVNHFPWWLPWWAPRTASQIRAVPVKARSRWTWPFVQLRRFTRYARRQIRQATMARLSSVERQRYRWRKKLAALLALQHDMGPGGLGLLLENDELFVVHLQRFLAAHNVPYSPPLFGPRGEYLYAAPGKVKIMATALLHAVARGKDNEMFVILADLLELGDQLEPLLRAVQVARARHHQVTIVCPWPVGIPPPDPQASDAEPRFDARLPRKATELRRFLHQTTTRQMHHAFFTLRRSMGRVGVPVICAAWKDSVTIILKRVERLRQPIRGY